MLKSSASRLVLGILILIAAFELGVSGKFSTLWQLAFTGKSSTSSPSSPASSSTASTSAAAPAVSGGKPSLR